MQNIAYDQFLKTIDINKFGNLKAVLAQSATLKNGQRATISSSLYGFVINADSVTVLMLRIH